MKKEQPIIIKIFQHAGAFAENKDKAAMLRSNQILPALESGDEIILDYGSVTSTTQSFTHALISESIRKYTPAVLDRIYFKDCNENVKKIIAIVIEYMQRRLDE